jgi:threonine synthase
MSGVNSINWARVLPQVVYYFAAAIALGAPDRPVSFSVPTGNFGDIYAGYVALNMGLPIRRLIVASNVNDILTRAIRSGDHSLSRVEPTMSPSMDIQVSSNFERLLFDAYDRDGGQISALMTQLAEQRKFEIPPAVRDRIEQIFSAQRVDESQTLQVMSELYRRTRYMVDPHTAVGLGAAQREAADDPDTPMVVLGTAHPAKFPDAVEKAIGRRPELPPHLADLFQRQERFEVMPAEVERIKAFIRERVD